MLSTKKSKPSREYISSLERSLQVLKCFTSETPELTISEIAVVTELNKAVVRRCLHTFLHLGYVKKVGKLFVLGVKVMDIGSSFLESMRVEEAFRPALQKLSDATGDTSSLAVLQGENIVFLVYVSTAPTIQKYVGVGIKFPAYVAAMGRTMLAHKKEEELDAYLENLQLEKFTKTTVPTTAQLRRILRQVKVQGYAIVDGELDENIVSLAVPIKARSGAVIASINCSTTRSKVGMAADEMVKTRLPALRVAAEEIEEELKHYPQIVHSLLGG
ncbi:MAG TPA: IclR family transcriptional regulator C-terminal domain-containing protein [Hyphomicrobiales bacterium]|nr:IclR family transcriptional regulator C-terminal domain-containing protein [Hyphomicrobiales bacterium]